MAYRDQHGAYPPQDMREQESQYPPPPGEEDPRAYHMSRPTPIPNVTLPSITTYPQHAQPQPQPAYQQYSNGYPPGEYQNGPAPPQYGRDDRPYQQDPYGRGAPPPPQGHMNFSQSAPRQRTAIACRYCRRRKIRCSGFDQNPEGRCSNCQRFQQECIFTPVSSQAQAFVPAHSIYSGLRNGRPGPGAYPPPGTQLYGAHGQPLGPINPQVGSPYSDYNMPSPTGSFHSYTDERAAYPTQDPNRERAAYPPQDQSRKRPQPDPHPHILPPPLPGQQSYPREAREDSRGRRPIDPKIEPTLHLPPVTPTVGVQPPPSNYSPGSSSSSHSTLQPPQSGLPAMSRTTPPRSSPGEARQNPMSLGHITHDRPLPPPADYDKGMLSRLDRRGQ